MKVAMISCAVLVEQLGVASKAFKIDDVIHFVPPYKQIVRTDMTFHTSGILSY